MDLTVKVLNPSYREIEDGAYDAADLIDHTIYSMVEGELVQAVTYLLQVRNGSIGPNYASIFQDLDRGVQNTIFLIIAPIQSTGFKKVLALFPELYHEVNIERIPKQQFMQKDIVKKAYADLLKCKNLGPYLNRVDKLNTKSQNHHEPIDILSTSMLLLAIIAGEKIPSIFANHVYEILTGNTDITLPSIHDNANESKDDSEDEVESISEDSCEELDMDDEELQLLEKEIILPPSQSKKRPMTHLQSEILLTPKKKRKTVAEIPKAPKKKQIQSKLPIRKPIPKSLQARFLEDEYKDTSRFIAKDKHIYHLQNHHQRIVCLCGVPVGHDKINDFLECVDMKCGLRVRRDFWFEIIEYLTTAMKIDKLYLPRCKACSTVCSITTYARRADWDKNTVTFIYKCMKCSNNKVNVNLWKGNNSLFLNP